MQIRFTSDLERARKDLDEASKMRADYDIKLNRLNEDVTEFKKRWFIQIIESLKKYQITLISRFTEARGARENEKQMIENLTAQLAAFHDDGTGMRKRLEKLGHEERRLDEANGVLAADLERAKKVDNNGKTNNKFKFQRVSHSRTWTARLWHALMPRISYRP